MSFLLSLLSLVIISKALAFFFPLVDHSFLLPFLYSSTIFYAKTMPHAQHSARHDGETDMFPDSTFRVACPLSWGALLLVQLQGAAAVQGPCKGGSCSKRQSLLMAVTTLPPRMTLPLGSAKHPRSINRCSRKRRELRAQSRGQGLKAWVTPRVGLTVPERR